MPEVGTELDRAIAALHAADSFGLDLETTGFSPHTDAIKGISLSVGPTDEQTWWFPFRGAGAVSQVQTLRALAPILADESKSLVGSNCKFDIEFLLSHAPDLRIRNRIVDTVVAHWLIDENSRHGLKQLAKKYLDVDMASYKEAAVHDGGLFPEIFAQYAKDDAMYVLQLWLDHLQPELERQNLTRLFHEVEMQIVPALIEMELRGVAINTDFLADLDARMQKQREEGKTAAFEIVGRKFRIESPKETSLMLYGEYGLKPFGWMHRGKSGVYSTDDAILARYDKDPLVAAILKYRNAAHMLKTYCKPYAARLKDDPRIYASFNQAGTKRGRFTSSNPNLQQVAPGIKDMFIASPGKKMVGGDFNQLQFRLVGHVAARILGNSKVAEAYLAGMDLHTKTQQEMGFDDRRPAKIVNFAFIFGRGWKAFAHDNRKTKEEAQDYYNGFHNAYPEIRRMAAYCRRSITKNGYVESIAGRRLHFPDMLGKRITGERDDPTYWPGWVAWNGMIQGAESDLVRIAMRNTQREIEKRRGPDSPWNEAYLQLQVHDEMIGEAPEEIAEEMAAMMKHEAENAVTLEVPVLFEVKVGDSWADVKG
jgi:DNA polymerase-1